jgi:hypothetical protein
LRRSAAPFPAASRARGLVSGAVLSVLERPLSSSLIDSLLSHADCACSVDCFIPCTPSPSWFFRSEGRSAPRAPVFTETDRNQSREGWISNGRGGRTVSMNQGGPSVFIGGRGAAWLTRVGPCGAANRQIPARGDCGCEQGWPADQRVLSQ